MSRANLVDDLTLTIETTRRELQQLLANQSGYQSWGEVIVREIAIRLNKDAWAGIQFEEGCQMMTHTYCRFDDTASELPKVIFNRRKKANFCLITEQVNASQVREDIPPILDDQAQLLGPSLRYVQDAGNHQKIIAALSGRYAVNLANGQTVCIGKNLEEAFIAAQLVEKTSKAFLEASHIGGAKSINKFEAWAMHKFFMLKYSKESEKNR